MTPQALQSTDLVDVNQQSDIPVTSNLSDSKKIHMESEEDEDEDDDIDFNPFLRGSPAAEASSSLSSEVEGLDPGVVDSGWEVAQPLAADSAYNQTDVDNDHGVDNSMQFEECIARKRVTLEEQCDQEQEETATRKSKKEKSVFNSESDKDSIVEKENGSNSGADVINDVTKEDANIIGSRMPAIVLDDEDAICKRTRARYSLASFTLDELETFLQETDDDDDLQNVDEEEEYRKFLAAVLQDGDRDDQVMLENGNDEDEDNDADFEIEIEEALESDVDDRLIEKEKLKAGIRRPETRQNRRQKAFNEGKKKFFEQEKRLLRPLLPMLPTTLIAPVPSNLMVETPNLPSSANGCSLNGFTPHQLGQLYCLIHEHVQLLIQVFSLCVLEPSRRNIATQIQGLLTEMLDKCDQAVTRRNVPHPSFCFHPPYIHPSVIDEHLKYLQHEKTAGSYEMNDDQRELSSLTNKCQGSTDLQSCNANGRAMKETLESFQAVHGSSWLPFVVGPVLSILDVAPLKLVGKYMDDVSTAVQEQMRRYVEAISDVNSEKQPLFPLSVGLSFAEANVVTAKGGAPTSSAFVTDSSSSMNHRPAKKTLAATLVESSKKQSVALVPKRIADLAMQFYTLFNPSLFPHKPPPLAVANRVLFTDAEDELLAMGLMEYNTDWKAIQQRFLPCKSKHQIFVRQKNRCSSKAPDNPIKEVRRLKTSPLTDEEKARIDEGLKVFKLDWMSIWKFIVPYRDPSLLPRQWRIALGTQKSYKGDATKREKRRKYEQNRRRNKALAAESLHASDKEDEHTGVQNESADECVDNNNEAYVHEAFLADWRPALSVPVSEMSISNLSSRCQLTPVSAEQGSTIRSVSDNHGNHECRVDRECYAHECSAVSEYSQKAGYGFPRPYGMDPSCPTSASALKPAKFVSYSRPYRARGWRSSQLVRLAPSLPPVNLPPTVRVISQAAFQNSQHTAPNQAASACAVNVTRRENTASRSNQIVSSTSDLNNVIQKRVNITASSFQESQHLKDKSADQESGTESDLQMHPLLFQHTGNGHLPYYPLSSSSTAPNSFCFFPVSPHQVNLAPLQNSQRPGAFVAGLDKSTSLNKPSCSLDFHPLLQSIDNVSNGSKVACQSNQFSTDLEPSRDAISPFVAGSELDLEINLSSAPRKEKDSAADGTEVLLPSSGGNICNKGGVNDQSLPEIVMEQEELSDSDDEIEHVEFEREEMADSEGEDEESYSHLIPNAQNMQPDVTLNTDNPHQLCESVTCRKPDSSESRAKTPPQTDLSGPTEDIVRSPLLSLNTQGSHRSHHCQAKCLVSSSDAKVASSTANTVASHSNRPQKNTTPRVAKNITSSESSFDVQPQAESLAVTARLPRKRASRTSNMDVGNSSCRNSTGS